MRVKTFRGKDMQAVLGLVKAEMGPEAVILSNQTINESGERQCEIMAALESEAAPTKKRTAPDRAAVSRNGNGRGKSYGPLVDGEDWKREWGEIKDHFMALLKPRMELDRLAPRQRLAMEFLEKEGVESSALLAVYRSIKERGEKSVLPALSRMVGVRPLVPDAWPQTFQALAGPHGVGKTTTLLRLALAHKRARPKADVHVVNAAPRGAGRLVLRHYAELSGLIYKEIRSENDFNHLAETMTDEDRAFVDLPALTRDETLEEWLDAHGMGGRADVAVHTLLSPSYGEAQLRRFADRYRPAGAGSIVWTKLDEACSFGGLINMAQHTGLPVSALAFGPELKNCMAPASANAVWRLIFKHEPPESEKRDAA